MFQAKHFTQSQSIHLLAPPQQVFPLFTPLGEKEWVAGWNPEIIYPANGEPEVGAVFMTQHSQESVKTIWTITHFDSQQFRATYVKVTPESRLDLVEVSCIDNHDGTTTATVTYTFTALSEAGNHYIDSIMNTHAEAIKAWEPAINHYLRYGILQH